MTRYDQNTITPDSASKQMYKQMTNPIRDNRIVSDKTFAVRLCKFLEQVEVHDLASEEEKEYLLGVARRLLNYQKASAQTAEETEYFKRLGL